MASLIRTDAFLILILALTAFTVVVSPKIKLPPTVGLVLVGLLLNITGVWHPTLNPDLVFYMLLPIVIFEASFNLTTHDFIADWPRTVFLAFPGVGVMCVIVGYGVHMLGQPYAVAFLFAAIVAATDPVSVVALFRDLGRDAQAAHHHRVGEHHERRHRRRGVRRLARILTRRPRRHRMGRRQSSSGCASPAWA